MKQKAMGIIKRLSDNGHKAFIVGGAVRDILLGKEPSDYDVATSARLPDIVSVFPNAKVIGKAYEIALVDGVEVAPFRRDSSCDGRQAEVEFVDTIEEDLSRRDFTINAMAMGLDGKVIDPFGGRGDLLRYNIRFVGSPIDRLKEDWLRGIRAIRFSSSLLFSIEQDSWSAIFNHAESVASNVSAERMLLEFKKCGNFSMMLVDMWRFGILRHVLPEVIRLKDTDQDPEWHPEGNVLTHSLLTVEKLSLSAGFTTKIAALLHDTGKVSTTEKGEDGRISAKKHEKVSREIAETVCRRLKMSNNEIEEVKFLVGRHMLLKQGHLKKKTFRRLKASHGEKLIKELFLLNKADILASSRNFDNTIKNRELWGEVKSEPEDMAVNVKPVISGNEVMELLGLKPGPSVGAVLRELLSAQLESEVPFTQDMARDLIKERGTAWV